MQKTAQTGKYGEELARKHLETKGFVILENNWRHKRSEIDLICLKDSVIVFVEVKVRTNPLYGMPETFVDDNKIRKMHEAAEEYIIQKDWKGELRFDIIAIEKDDALTHFEDAFY